MPSSWPDWLHFSPSLLHLVQAYRAPSALPDSRMTSLQTRSSTVLAKISVLYLRQAQTPYRSSEPSARWYQSRSACISVVPYRSSLRYNSMVHDTSHEPKSKHLSIHAWKAARSVSAHSWARPLRSLYLGLRTRSLSWNENWARISNQGHTVHANFVMSGSCSRNRGYVSNRDVPCRSSLRHNSMGPLYIPAW